MPQKKIKVASNEKKKRTRKKRKRVGFTCLVHLLQIPEEMTSTFAQVNLNSHSITFNQSGPNKDNILENSCLNKAVSTAFITQALQDGF